MTTPPAAPPQAERHSDPLSDFQERQWWVTELDGLVQNGTDDQKRAVAVVHNLLRAVTKVAQATPPQAVYAEQLGDERIVQIWNSGYSVTSPKTAVWFARAVLLEAEALKASLKVL